MTSFYMGRFELHSKNRLVISLSFSVVPRPGFLWPLLLWRLTYLLTLLLHLPVIILLLHWFFFKLLGWLAYLLTTLLHELPVIVLLLHWFSLRLLGWLAHLRTTLLHDLLVIILLSRWFLAPTQPGRITLLPQSTTKTSRSHWKEQSRNWSGWILMCTST